METDASRIRLLERCEVAGELAGLYDKLIEQRGAVPNMFKTLARTPELAMGVAAFLKPLMGDGALAGWYKELVAVRVAQLSGCHY